MQNFLPYIKTISLLHLPGYKEFFFMLLLYTPVTIAYCEHKCFFLFHCGVCLLKQFSWDQKKIKLSFCIKVINSPDQPCHLTMDESKNLYFFVSWDSEEESRVMV
jgi:hypothetical protein